EASGIQDAVGGFGIRYAVGSGAPAAKSPLTGADYPAMLRAGCRDDVEVAMKSREWLARATGEDYDRFLEEVGPEGGVRDDAARGIPITASGADAVVGRAWTDFEPGVRFCPGVGREWLEELRRVASGLAVVTDGDIVNVNRLVKRLDLERYFGAIITSEAVRAYKPNPRIYRAALEALGAAPRDSVFVSDTPLDLQGAAAVGMRTALLPR